MLERPKFLPFFRNGRLLVPFNRSEVIAPFGQLQIVLSFRFPPGSLLAVDGAVTVAYVRFTPQTDGHRIWGLIDNGSGVPRHLTPKMLLCSIQTPITHLEIPDAGLIELSSSKTAPVLKTTTARRCDIDSLLASCPALIKPGLGCCKDYMVRKVPFCHSLPRQQQPYHVAHQEDQLILREVLKLQEMGVIREVSWEPYLIPVFAIPKKTGDVRLVLDFRKFNACVTFEPYLPVHRQFLMARVRPYCVGSIVDLSHAYFQVSLAPELHRFFGIVVSNRFFVYQRLPFGYHNSPCEFLRALQPAVQEIQASTASQFLVYMDDVLLLSASEEEHLRDLATVFRVLQRRGWRIRPDKCQFLQTTFEALGCVISPDGWRPSQAAVDRLVALPRPQTRATWRSVKGWFQQLVRFIPHGQQIQQLLATAEQSGEDDDWQRFLRQLEQQTIECTHALEGDAFGVTVDSSQAGWGSCLLQNDNIVCCASGLWPQSIRHQMSNHLEMEAVVKALRTFRPWTFGAQVTVLSDNAAVVSAQNPDNHSDFIKRRLDELQEFCPRIQFIEGKANVLSDLLSRQSLIFAADRPANRREQLSTLQASEDVEDEGLLLAHQGHFGINRTYAMAKELGLSVTRSEVEAFVRRCRACQQFLPKRPSGPLGHLPDPTHPGELLAMDFIGPLRRAPP